MTLPHILIPVKSLSQGKSRLAGLLHAEARRALTEDLTQHAISVAVGYGGLARVAVVSHCIEVQEIARTRGVQGILHCGTGGLCAAVSHGLRELRAQGAGDVVVMASDLPKLSAADLRDTAALGLSRGAVCDARRMQAKRIVIGADRHGLGTNLLFVPAGVAMRFYYGPHSLEKHLAEAARLGVEAVVQRGERLGFDVDTPDDFLEWQPQHTPLQLAA